MDAILTDGLPPAASSAILRVTVLPDNRQRRFLLRHTAAAQDVALAGELRLHLDVVQRFAGVDVWTAARIRTDDERHLEIGCPIVRADVELPFLSADFLTSGLLQEAEVRLLTAESGSAAVRLGSRGGGHEGSRTRQGQIRDRNEATLQSTERVTAR